MGRSKALLPFGTESMLQRVVRLLGQAVDLLVVAAAEDQPLPPLPTPVQVVRDRRPDRGPLEGLAAGLAALAGRAEVAFVTGCDVPLLVPAFVRRVVELVRGYDVAVPHVDGWDEPLAAAYRVDLLPRVESLLEANRLRPAFLFQQVHTRRIDPSELVEVDPELSSLANVNTPEDYRAALAKARLA